MRAAVAGRIAIVVAAGFLSSAVFAQRQMMAPHESRVSVGGASLYVREVGQGPTTIVLHGGPDFDSAYLLPDLDRLADEFHLVYYDQRGRGRSAANVDPGHITIESEVEDLDAVRRHVGANQVVLLGHSWGTVLALEYAIRHPDRVSRVILMNPAPASAADLPPFRKYYLEKLGAEMEKQRAISASPAYRDAEPAAVQARYRIHFRPAFARTEAYERLMSAMKAEFIRQGSAGILEARAVEDRLMEETWNRSDYDLTPKLQHLELPTLVIWADHDFIPALISDHITSAVRGARMITMSGCGHFSYLECPDQVRGAIDAFMRPR